MLGLDLSCAAYHQDRWVFCPAMFLAGFVACVITFALAYVASYRRLLSAGFKPVDVEDAAIRAVSVVHALWLAIPFTHALLTETLQTRYTTHYRCATFLISASLGYFLFDTVALMHWAYAKGRTWRSELSMLWHHLFAAGGEYFTLVGHAGGFLVASLMMSEFTTPMLHLLYILEKIGYLGDNKRTKFLCGFFVVQWLVFRLGVSSIFIVYLAAYYQDFLHLTLFNQVLYVSVACFFNFINAFWFFKLLKKGSRLAEKSKADSKKSR